MSAGQVATGRPRASELAEAQHRSTVLHRGPTTAAEPTPTQPAGHERDHQPCEQLGDDRGMTSGISHVPQRALARSWHVERQGASERDARLQDRAVHLQLPAVVVRDGEGEHTGSDRTGGRATIGHAHEGGVGAGDVGARQGLRTRLVAGLRRCFAQQRTGGDPGTVLERDVVRRRVEPAQIELGRQRVDQPHWARQRLLGGGIRAVDNRHHDVADRIRGEQAPDACGRVRGHQLDRVAQVDFGA